MRKITLALAAFTVILATLGLASSANATVAVDTTGTGFVGKGDVQDALGLANDQAMQSLF